MPSRTRHRLVLLALYALASLSLALFIPSKAAAVSLLATVWLSFVLSISFTEAWVKFKAPTLSKSAAVDAGRHVFSALNKVELGLAAGVSTALFSSPSVVAWRRLAAVPLAALLLDVLWLTPALDRRARELIVAEWKGKERGGGAAAAVAEMERELRGAGPTPPASLHLLYVLLEGAKVVSLSLLVRSAGRVAFAL